MPSAPCIYGHGPDGLRRDHPCLPPWRSLLTPEWDRRVVEPESFQVFREYEIPARRVIGYDTDDRPCFCTYDYRLIDPRSDDDEDFYAALTYGESVTAWRIDDGRWLTHRRMEPIGDEGETVSDFTLSDRMPR